MGKKNWSRKLKIEGKYSPVVLLTKDNILQFAGDFWMGNRAWGMLDSVLKKGLEKENNCWLIRNPSMHSGIRVGKTVIEKELGLEIFDTYRKDRMFYLVDCLKAKKSLKGLK